MALSIGRRPHQQADTGALNALHPYTAAPNPTGYRSGTPPGAYGRHSPLSNRTGMNNNASEQPLLSLQQGQQTQGLLDTPSQSPTVSAETKATGLGPGPNPSVLATRRRQVPSNSSFITHDGRVMTVLRDNPSDTADLRKWENDGEDIRPSGTTAPPPSNITCAIHAEIDNILSQVTQTYVPYLKHVLSTLKRLWDVVRQNQRSKEQLGTLVHFSARLLQVLNTECTAGRVLHDKILDDFHRLVIDTP